MQFHVERGCGLEQVEEEQNEAARKSAHEAAARATTGIASAGLGLFSLKRELRRISRQANPALLLAHYYTNAC